jgi:hypothetical protein
MSRKISLFMGLALALFANAGCCAWADRWCHRNQQPVAATPQCCVPTPQACFPAPAPQACYPAPQPCYPVPPQGYQRPYGQ